MQPRYGLMRQLHEVGKLRGLNHQALHDLFCPRYGASLAVVDEAVLTKWIRDNGRPLDPSPKRKRGKLDKWAYLDVLLIQMCDDGWPREHLNSVLYGMGVDRARKIVVAGSVSKAIAKLWQMRRHGWHEKGIAPRADTRRRRGEPVVQSSALSTEAVSC
jgi:hypothetical protein